MTVTQPQYENILYIKSSESIGHQLVIQHLTHEQRSQMSMKQYIDQLAYQFQRDVRTQQKIASETLKVHQMIPIFLSKSLILCPLQSQRAAIQYYIMSHTLSPLRHISKIHAFILTTTCHSLSQCL